MELVGRCSDIRSAGIEPLSRRLVAQRALPHSRCPLRLCILAAAQPMYRALVNSEFQCHAANRISCRHIRYMSVENRRAFPDSFFCCHRCDTTSGTNAHLDVILVEYCVLVTVSIGAGCVCGHIELCRDDVLLALPHPHHARKCV